MGLSVSLITFSPNTVIKSADVNANFQQVLNAATYTGSVGAVNNTNVLIDIDDIDITVKNGSHTCHSSRHKHHHDSDDRCHALSVKNLNVTINAIVFDETGQGHTLQGHLNDKYGNHYPTVSHFSGSGSGTYSHGLIGVTPLMVSISPNSSSAVSVSVKNIGSSTVDVHLSSSVGFDGLAIYYSDTD